MSILFQTSVCFFVTAKSPKLKAASSTDNVNRFIQSLLVIYHDTETGRLKKTETEFHNQNYWVLEILSVVRYYKN
jgi:hypothetical protein